MRQIIIFCLLTTTFAIAAEPTSREWYQAIRSNNLSAIKTMASSKVSLNVTDSRGTTPLMQAAAIGSLEAVKLLIAAGADVNASNGLDITPLIYASVDAEKVKVLVAAGANVNAASKMKRTPLIAAANRPNAAETIRLLLSKGANPTIADVRGATVFTEAGRANDTETIKLLLAHPVDINAGGLFGLTALANATANNNPELVKLLLDKGANPNISYSPEMMVRNGPIALTKLTPLMMAPMSSPECIQQLLAAGAEVNARDGRGMTALMFAAASDKPNLAILRMLLKAGADTTIKSNINETATDWAAKFNHPEVMKLLNAQPLTVASATSQKNPDLHASLTKSITLLQSTSTEYFKNSGCVGCHHQPLIGLAVERAMHNGIAIDEAARKTQTQVVRAENLSARDVLLQGVFISVDALAHSVQHFNEVAYPADEVTDALVSMIASQQQADGHFSGVPVVRPPMEDSNWTRTALAAMSLARYPIPARRAEFEHRVAKARRWMAETKPELDYEQVFQLLGLVWTGASAREVNSAVAAVKKLQRKEGGWGQTANLPSDAFATGSALYALQLAGIPTTDTVSKRAVGYLLRTQLSDGSWHVASRGPKLQPYFQSGFPHEHDQWISAAATGWAVAALSNTMPKSSKVAALR